MNAPRAERSRPLLAKSAPSSEALKGAATLRGHTGLVLLAARELLEHRAEASLRAAGLPLALVDRLRRLVLMGAAVHDLGKCSDHFQEMVRHERTAPQLLRHEALSLWMCWPGQPLASWLMGAVDDEKDLCLALVAAAAHHRKFWAQALAPADSGAGSSISLLMHHPDFHATLKRIAAELKLSDPPDISAPLVIQVSWRSSPEAQLLAWQEDFARLAPHGSLEARLLPVVKALVLAADVAGSALSSAGETSKWVGAQLSQRATGEELMSVVAKRLENQPLRPFQQAVAASGAPVTLARAGCGSGKTVAAYAWAAQRHPGRQVWVTYPTTGTATEGFRSYLRDTELSALLDHSRAEVDLKLIEDHRPDPKVGNRGADRLDSLRAWGMDVLTCTVDTVLGLVQNQRKGLYAWPALCDACVVFDEVHAYDARLFGALLRFLEALPGIPALLMTASLPAARLEALRALCRRVHGVPLAEVEGPADLEGFKRYQRVLADPWSAVEECLAHQGKVLWVSNTVDRCLEVAEAAERRNLPVRRYHSRFRYVDRVERHEELIHAFGQEGPIIACTTQVAEMSLDLSAQLLVTDRAPIPALIQRLGRLNRRSPPTGPAPFLVLPFAGQPYASSPSLLDEADAWLEKLGLEPVSQRDLVDAWDVSPEDAAPRPVESAWLDDGFNTLCGDLRESSPGLTVLRAEDVEAVRQKRVKALEVALPMNPPPRGLNWKDWKRVDFLPVASPEVLDYDSLRGARWRKP